MSFKSAFSYSNTSTIQLQLIKHRRILTIILSVSPEKIQTHIKDCVIKNNTLLIYVSSAAWASQLRFCSAQIQQAVNAQSNERINKIRIRVLAPEPFKMQEEITKVIPSVESINMLRDNADSLAEGKLKDALLGLSKALQRYNQS
ncbi:MAG: hypothetical protein DRQ62_14740 [Gammaproteobacteria bacterium]|nr:MAG: hypothetical protein DRQ62_14740 [Gammaproteobacteria bacterium]